MSEGMDGHKGDTFSDFTRGETLPFSFQFTEEDGVTPETVTDNWVVVVAFATEQTCEEGTAPDIEVILTLEDESNAIFSGSISDDETFSVDSGIMYASARFIIPDGSAFIIDKARVTVFPCVNTRRTT